MENYFFKQGAKIKDKEVEDLIEDIGIELPLEYMDFLKKINGGITIYSFLELRKFDTKATDTNFFIKIEKFFELKELHQVYEYTSDLLNGETLFSIAEVRNGALICCNQSHTAKAKIYYYDNDFGILSLTDSLSDFLDELISVDDVDYKKYDIDF